MQSDSELIEEEEEGQEEIENGEEAEGEEEENNESRSVGLIPDQERFLPIANISRIMKRMIPGCGKIAKDAKECVQECVSEFISFLTSEASDNCNTEKRKTICSDDLMDALVKLGFDDYIEPMRIFMARYRTAHRLPPNPNGRILQMDVTNTIIAMHSNGNASSTAQIASTDENAQNPATFQMATLASAPTSAESDILQIVAPTDVLNDGTEVPQTAVALTSDQLYIDPETKQHYFAIHDGNGSTQLIPFTVAQTDSEGMQYILVTEDSEGQPLSTAEDPTVENPSTSQSEEASTANISNQATSRPSEKKMSEKTPPMALRPRRAASSRAAPYDKNNR